MKADSSNPNSSSEENEQKKEDKNIKPQNAPLVKGTPEDASEKKGPTSIQFKNPLFHFRLNVFVRPGDTWLERTDWRSNRSLRLIASEKQKEAHQVGQATIQGISYLPINLIPLHWISLNPEVRRPDDISKHEFQKLMEDRYGFSGPAMVTVILFTLDKIKEEYYRSTENINEMSSHSTELEKEME